MKLNCFKLTIKIVLLPTSTSERFRCWCNIQLALLTGTVLPVFQLSHCDKSEFREHLVSSAYLHQTRRRDYANFCG